MPRDASDTCHAIAITAQCHPEAHRWRIVKRHCVDAFVRGMRMACSLEYFVVKLCHVRRALRNLRCVLALRSNQLLRGSLTRFRQS